MTIYNLITLFAVLGGAIWAATWRIHKNRVVAFLQYFVGVWFIFSGVVKAIDPMGTAFKMDDYFAEFVRTFEPTSFSFLASMFEALGHYTLAFSLIMIVFEILIGVLLILGHLPRFAAWSLTAIMVFFTVLTGYTHLTGYVADGVNFFEFSKWGKFVTTNMKVTDCGCFGDFLKLDPSVSFVKDLCLMPITLFLLWKTKDYTDLLALPTMKKITWGSLAVTVLFCFYNTYMDEPLVDFRPFRIGVNIREQKKAEEKAMADVKILTWVYRNISTGERKELPDAEYMSQKLYEKYNKNTGWELDEQIKTTPSVPRTKISDFSLNNKEGEDVAEQLLAEKGYTFLAVSWKMPVKVDKKTVVMQDSTFQTDTIIGNGKTQLVRKFTGMKERKEVFKSFSFDADYRMMFTSKINPILDRAEKDGFKTGVLVNYVEPKQIEDFRHAAQTAHTFYTADDKLVKTMIRSNPGLYLLKDGKIVNKWHYKKLPSYDEIKKQIN